MDIRRHSPREVRPGGRWEQTSPAVAALLRAAGPGATRQSIGETIGYSREQMAAVPEGANLGLGCGNPVALASLRAGETVLDLGSGAGFDCFLAAQAVGDIRPGDRGRHDPGDAGQGARERRQGRLPECRVPPGRDRTPAGSGCLGGHHHLQLRDQPVARQAAGLRRGVPGPATGRAARGVGHRPLEAAAARRWPNSVAAYVGCLAGASLKEDYLEHAPPGGIRARCGVVGESAFDIGDMAHDPMVKAIIEEARLSPEEIARGWSVGREPQSRCHEARVR